VWAGNSGTEPGAGSGTCGSAALSVSGSLGSYHKSYSYTHLGQLWQVKGGGSQLQYLYCNSSAPHQLTAIVPLSGSCSNQSGATYTSSYDAWGNVTSRTSNGTTASLSYDLLDHFVRWSTGSSNKEWYVYDASGQRVLRRSQSSTGTNVTVYVFGQEEHTYSFDSSGTLTSQSQTYYYNLGGSLLGALEVNGSSSATDSLLTDMLGSVLATITNTVNSASVVGNQLYDPYGNNRDQAGSMATSKGFTGQYNDSLTGLDYYGSRSYDPTAGVFLCADPMQGDLAATNP
jgi:RHS repeat-associated protein